jgi:hypothetical protein
VRPYLKIPFTKIGVVEVAQGESLSSSPNTTKQKQKQNPKKLNGGFCILFSKSDNSTSFAKQGGPL